MRFSKGSSEALQRASDVFRRVSKGLCVSCALQRVTRGILRVFAGTFSGGFGGSEVRYRESEGFSGGFRW